MSRELTLHKGLIGKNLGKIKILSVLGQGGMGIVFKGVHELLEKEVAVKILPFSPMMPSSGRDRFLREARLAAKLEHPNIVQVYDVEQGPAFDYIVMQFVEGCSLAELIHQKGTLEFDEVLYLLRQTLEGMAFAHSKGIVHRDIKPANILITKEGQAKIADFGLSRNLVSETLTESGIVMGTPEYMAPEQAHGEEVDGRADIYSLAITFYHALTGTLPFTGSRPLKIIMNKLDKKLPLVHQKMSEIPPSFSVILQKMAHPDVSLRYSSCREIFSDLEKIILPSMPKISQKLATMTMEIQKSRLEIQREEEASEKNTSAYDYLEILSGVQLRGNLEAQVEGEHENKRLAEKLSNKYHLILSCCAIVFLLLLGWYFLFSLPQQKEYKRLFREAQKAFQEGRYYQAKTLAHIIQSEYQNTPEIKAFLQKIESRNPYQYYLEKAKMAYQKGKFLQAKEFVLKARDEKNSLEAIKFLEKITQALERRPLSEEEKKKAIPIGAKGTLQGKVSADKSIIYLFSPNKKEYYQILLSLAEGKTPFSEEIQLDMQVYNQKGETLLLAASPHAEEKVEIEGGLTYYLKILNLSSSEAAFVLKIRWRKIPSRHISGFVYEETKIFKPLGKEKMDIYYHSRTGLKFVFLKGGKFVMGQEKGNPWDQDNYPPIQIQLAPFLISQTEVTQGVWEKIMGSRPWEGERKEKYLRKGASFPAVYIDWWMAWNFCKKTGLSLPSEAQWEYACRGGTDTGYCWGNQKDSRFGWFDDETRKRKERYAHSVATKLPNPFGLYDMAGNVWEWCQDIWHPSLKGLKQDGSPWDQGEPLRYVIRGGSWLSGGNYYSSFNRSWQDWSSATCDKGFRVVYNIPR